MAVVCAFSALGSICLADTVLTASVQITGSHTSGAVLPVEGDYRFVFGRNQATVSSPNGKIFVFDFASKSFTSRNPVTRTYYQADISSVLGVGDRLPSRDSSNKIKGAVTFEPAPTGVPQPDLAAEAKSFRLLLESTLFWSTGSPGGFGGSFNTQGGFAFGGGTNRETTRYEGKRVLEGQLWMGSAPAGVDRDQLNAAFECILLWGAPQLTELSHRVHDSNLAILGADFSVRTEGQRTSLTTPPPLASIKVTSVQSGTLDPQSLIVPADYRRTSPPVGPWGG